MNVYDIQDLQNVETLSAYVDLQAIFQLIILILIVIISICTIMYIQKNIKLNKNTNKVIRYGTKKFFILGIINLIVLCFLKYVDRPSSYIGLDIEKASIQYNIFIIILFIIYILLLTPQVYTIIQLRKNIKKEGTNKIEKINGKSTILLVIGTIIVYAGSIFMIILR